MPPIDSAPLSAYISRWRLPRPSGDSHPMTHYTISYHDHSREDADTNAVADMLDFLGEAPFKTLVEAAADPTRTIQSLNFLCGFAGVTGFPFHAFCRRYALERYVAWMNSGDDAVPTGDDGFPLSMKLPAVIEPIAILTSVRP